MKSKIAITVDEHLLSRIDAQRGLKSRSGYIEALLREGATSRGIRNAVILAGGEGTRLRPITYEIPKPLVPVNGKAIITRQIEMLQRAGIDNIIVATHYKADKVKAAVGKGVTFVDESKPMGTGGALLGAKDHLSDRFLVMNGDLLFKPLPNIPGMDAFHIERKSFASFLVTMRPDVSRFGRITLADDGKITDFTEKPPEGGAGLISVGMYIFEPGIFDYIKGKASLEHDVFPKIQKEHPTFGYFYDGKMFDVGTFEEYERAIKEWTVE
ncbi:MAG: NTP transferase domain-containing protein [Nanoarchaeota archaeon]|nr:NTP transferase domain-containing protein [Nanoarchaeota archaeon]